MIELVRERSCHEIRKTSTTTTNTNVNLCGVRFKRDSGQLQVSFQYIFADLSRYRIQSFE